MKAKKQYYSSAKIRKLHAQYNILLGERSNGKSYDVKFNLVTDAYKGVGEFVYIRRYSDDIKTMNVERYFTDTPIYDITNGEYDTVVAYRNELFFAKFDDEGNKVKGKKMGYYLSLNNDERVKSQSFPNVISIVFEEFITDKIYLPDECNRFLHLVSTIARDRDVTVWMIGNKINKVCPYFREWNLKNALNQEIGTIDKYEFTRHDEDGNPITTLIAVEQCQSSGTKSKMFFGTVADSITGGVWQSHEVPHLIGKLEDYTRIYEVLFTDLGFSFVLQLLVKEETGGMFVFCYPAPKNPNRHIYRKITSEFSIDPLTTNSFNVTINGERIMRDLIKAGKICFSDNMTGTDFNQVLLNRKGVL